MTAQQPPHPSDVPDTDKGLATEAALLWEVVDTLHGPAAVVDSEGRVLRANGAFERVFPELAASESGRCLCELASDRWDTEAIRDVICQRLPREKAIHDVVIGTAPSIVQPEALRMSARRIGHTGMSLVSVQPAADATAALREREALVAVAENSPDFIGIATLEGRPTYLNAAGFALLGLSADVPTPDHIDVCFEPEYRALAHAAIEKARAGERFAAEVLLRNFATGEPIAVNWNVFPILDPVSGAPVAIATVSRDIREQKRIDAERAAAHARQSRIARELQHALLRVPPTNAFPGLQFVPIYLPVRDEALVGGDFYDAFVVRSGTVAFVVGDATGKGLNAATYTAEVRFALRAFLREHGSPAVALGLLSAFIAENVRLDTEYLGGSYVAASVVVVDTGRSELICATAGAEPPLLRHVGSGRVEEMDGGGPLLGVLPDAAYDERRIAFSSGDLLVVATDGITEARNPERRAGPGFFGQQGLIDALAPVTDDVPLRKIGDGVIGQVLEWTGGVQHDDICLLLVRAV